MPQLLTTMKVHDQVLLAKLALAKPRVLARDRAMTNAVMELAKGTVRIATPLGPGHFGYHGRDTLKVDVSQKGLRTVGKLSGAIQMYWREYGTRGYFRGGKAKTRLTARQSRSAGAFLGGEPAFYTAHKALSGFKSIVRFYYGSVALWWRA